MSKVSRETASKVNDMGAAEDRTEEFDGDTVNFVTLRKDADLAQMLVASHEWCKRPGTQAPDW
jgi:hypothetical protein